MKRTRRGYVLLATLFMMATLVLLAGALMPVVMNEIDAEKGMENMLRLNDLERGIQAYFWDTGQLPAGTDRTALTNLFVNGAGVPGWRGPYSSYTPDYGLADPWRTRFIYRTGIVDGIPVVLIGSGGRNRHLDTDLSDWPNTPIASAGDDLMMVFELDRLSEFQDEKTVNVLNLTKAIIYNTFTATAAPATYENPAMTDAWGHSVQYHRCAPQVAVLFSLGYNGLDDSAAGEDICINRRTGGDDLFVWLTW
jgi:type II secretory pathway pseudopilin PulG